MDTGDMLTLTVRRNGTSLNLDIPEEVASSLNLREGEELHVSVMHGRLILTPCDAKFRETMEAAEEAFERYKNAYAELAKK
jgi:putative addiction module antidote